MSHWETELKKYDKVIVDKQNDTEKSPTHIDFYNRGVCYQMLKDFKPAISDYTKSLEMVPDHVSALINRSHCYFSLDECQKCIEDCNRGIELEPSSQKMQNLYMNRAGACNNSGRFKEAVDDYAKVIQLNPLNGVCYIHRACAYDNLGENKLAVEDSTKAIELTPHDPYGYMYRSFGNNFLGEYEKAIEDSNTVITMGKEERIVDDYALSFSHACLAYAYSAGFGQFERSLQIYKKSLELDPENPITFFLRGCSFCIVGKYEDSIKDLKTSLKFASFFQKAKEKLKSVMILRDLKYRLDYLVNDEEISNNLVISTGSGKLKCAKLLLFFF